MQDKKIGLVAGGTRGLGYVITKILIDSGCICYFTGRNAEDGEKTAKNLGNNAIFVQCDSTDEQAVENLFHIIGKEHHHLDFAVNNAGVTTKRKSIADADINEWRRVIDTNIIGTTMLLSGEIKLMRQNGGSIVNISSCAGIQGTANQGAYATSKAAINMLTKVASMECGKKDMHDQTAVIRINAICPGAIIGGMNTEEHLKANPETTAQKVNTNLLKRFAKPEEITHSVMWLLSKEASYVTGAIIDVDAGYSAGKF